MSQRFRPADRRTFIGGSDARIIMGDDAGALLQLWRQKRGEAEPEDLSGNLIVQLGLATEPTAYFRLLCDFWRRTPGPPPFSSMNSIPAPSRARRTAESFAAVIEVSSSASSARRIVATPKAASRARSCARQRRKARAALI